MPIKSLTEALGYLIKSPLVWTPGIAIAAIAMLGFWLYQQIGIMTATSVVLVLLFILPLLLAGVYGMISETGGFATFRKYAIKGYFRCLLPILMTLLIAYLLSQFIAYLLLIMGMNYLEVANFALFILIPIIFFCYFADITAVVNNLRVFQSLKDSCLRVMNGNFGIAVFYMINVCIIMIASFVTSMIWSVLAAEAITPLLEMTQEELLAIPQEELIAWMLTPETVFATTVALAIGALIFVPIALTYKACFFKKTSPLVITTPIAEPEGEYDEKGRWYKYK